MSIEALSPLSATFSKEQTEIDLSLEQLKIDRNLLSSLTAIKTWQLLLTNEGGETRNELQLLAKHRGLLPDSKAKISAVELERRDGVNSAAETIFAEVAKGKMTVEWLTERNTATIQRRFPELTKFNVELLQRILIQTENLAVYDPTPLAVTSPFPVTQHNFLGRFLSGGCESPRRAERHIQLASPFLIRLKTLFENLRHDQKNFIFFDIFSAVDREAQQAGRKPQPGRNNMPALRREALDLIHAAINQSHDFYDRSVAPALPPMNVVSFPRIHNIDAEHIPLSRRSELAVVLFNWLFFGKKDSELLQLKNLKPSRERFVAEQARELEKLQLDAKAHAAAEPRKATGSREHRIWARKERVLDKKIARREREIDSANKDRSAVVPLIRQLEDDAPKMASIRLFRTELAQSLHQKRKVIFSFLAKSDSEQPGSLISFLDLALNSKKFNQSESVKVLESCSFILSETALHRIEEGAVTSTDNVRHKSIRRFEINVDEINLSTKFLLGRMLPKAEDLKLSALLELIAASFNLPGIDNVKNFTFSVQKAVGKFRPSLNDYLEYTFSHLAVLPEPKLYALLSVLHQLKVTELPPVVRQLSEHRFKHPADVLQAFTRYSKGYQPNRLGQAPAIFTELSSFHEYRLSGMDALGMAPEIAKIQKHLVESGIVAVVDGTNYHPELDSEIGMTGDKLEKADAEKTSEVWGDYVKPSERVIRALSFRLVEGSVDSHLKNSSLMGVLKPDKVDQIYQKLIKKFYGLDIDIAPDLSAINQVLADLKLYDDNVILVVDARSINNLEHYREFLALLERYQIKIILRTREAFPGIPQVNLQPFMEHTVTDRIMADAEHLQRRLRLNKPITREVVEFAAQQVKQCRAPSADPLNLTLHALHGAASHAALHADRSVTEQDVVAALPAIFHLPDGQQMRLRLGAIESFITRAPLMVLGQEEAIATIGARMKSHLLGMRDPTRPLTILVPGPTGVGKTELMMHFARICDLPFFMIEGAEFSEGHTVSRLVGSPAGYVGADEGILFTFLKENSNGLVFIDEIEKMHPDVYQALMNFFDKATLTAGNGKTVTRPGFIIVGASNAGADKLTRKMSVREVKDILAESFVDRTGRPRPELVRRFEPIVMPAIEQPAFKKMLRASLQSIGKRPGFINANMRLVGIDDAALELLYTESRSVCQYDEEEMSGARTFGFPTGKPIVESELYFDLRHVSRALDELAGASLQQRATEQYESGASSSRGASLAVKLIGDTAAKKILLVNA